DQLKTLAREMRRAERLAGRLDRTLALADKEAGVQGSGFGLGRIPGLAGESPSQPFPMPSPGLPALSPGLQRGEFESTYGVSGTPITSGFLTDLGEYNPELMGAMRYMFTSRCAAATRRCALRWQPASCR